MFVPGVGTGTRLPRAVAAMVVIPLLYTDKCLEDTHFQIISMVAL